MGDEEKATAPKQLSGQENSGGGDYKADDATDNDVTETRPEMDERTATAVRQTSDIVWTFMHEYNEVQVKRGATSSSGQPSVRQAGTQTDDLMEIGNAVLPTTRKITVEEFSRVQSQDTQAQQFAHHLRRIAEDMDQTYRPTVVVLVSKWLMTLHRDSGQLTLDAVWTAFRRVVSSVVENGVTWGKVLLLLLFAYEIAVALYVEGVPQFVRSIISSFVRFLIESPVIKWIAEHGGWAAAVTALWIQSVKAQVMGMAPYIAWIVGVGSLALGAFLFSKRK